MTPRPPPRPPEKSGLHPRNPHRARYDFARLTQACPALAPFVGPTGHGDDSIDFADPAAVKALNQTLLKLHYGIAAWDLPDGYLCPPIPGRADYLHHLADLLAGDHAGAIPRGPAVTVLDIGVGANCVYPIIGRHDYGWRFVGTEIDPVALAHATRLVAQNPALTGAVQLRRQPSSAAVFSGVVTPDEHFAASICNPPFHASRAEALAGTRRKLKNLGAKSTATPVLNFGGRAAELWCAGGERGFIARMIAESALTPAACGWFTTLVARHAHLTELYRALERVRPADVRTIDMAQGQKQSRILAWTFLSAEQRRAS